MGIYNNEGKLINYTDIYPPYFDKIKDVPIKYRYGQGEIAFNENSGLLVYAGYFLGDIKFYHLSNLNELSFIKSYDLSVSNEIERRIDAGLVNIKKTDIEYFTDIYVTDKYFYILYSGQTMQERYKIKQSNIIVFDSMGNFTKCYKSSSNIRKICVDDNDEYLYSLAISDSLDYRILKMKLK